MFCQPLKRDIDALRRPARNDRDIKSLFFPLSEDGDRFIDRRHVQEFIRPMHDPIQLIAFVRIQATRLTDIEIRQLLITDPFAEFALDHDKEMPRRMA